MHREIVESLDICWVGIDEGVIVCTKFFLFGTRRKRRKRGQMQLWRQIEDDGSNKKRNFPPLRLEGALVKFKLLWQVVQY